LKDAQRLARDAHSRQTDPNMQVVILTAEYVAVNPSREGDMTATHHLAYDTDSTPVEVYPFEPGIGVPYNMLLYVRAWSWDTNQMEDHATRDSPAAHKLYSDKVRSWRERPDCDHPELWKGWTVKDELGQVHVRQERMDRPQLGVLHPNRGKARRVR
jgi:hypothetical protein